MHRPLYVSSYLASFFCTLTAFITSLPSSAHEYCDGTRRWQDVYAENPKWLTALRNREFDKLDRHFNGLQARYEAGQYSDEHVDRFFKAFGATDADLEPFFHEWIEHYPKSFAAHLSHGFYLIATGFAARGNKFGHETSDHQRDAMQRRFTLAARELEIAIALGKKPTLAYAARIDIAKTRKAEDARDWFERAERIDPSNVTVKSVYVDAIAPKWGGEDGELVKFREQIDASNVSERVKRYIHWQIEMALGDDARIGERIRHAIRHFERAARLCPAFFNHHNQLLDIYEDAEDWAGLRTAATKYLAVRPDYGFVYRKRAWANQKLGDLESAFKDDHMAVRYGDAWGAYRLAWYYEHGVQTTRDLEKALQLYTTAVNGGVVEARQEANRLRGTIR